MNSTPLTIKYLIDFLNDKETIKINRIPYLIDSYTSLKIGNTQTFNHLLTGILISCKNIKYKIDNNLAISLDENTLNTTKKDIVKKIVESNMDQFKKRKNIAYINCNSNTLPNNESILTLAYCFDINLIIYNHQSQIIKCYYYDNCLDKNLPFVLFREVKSNNSSDIYYELVFSNNKFIFDFQHPIITELIPNLIIVGFDNNKKLEFNNIDETKLTLGLPEHKLNNSIKLKNITRTVKDIIKMVKCLCYKKIKIIYN